MIKMNKRFGAFLLCLLMLMVAMVGCAEVEKGEITWKPTGGDPNVESQPTPAPEKIVEFGSYPNKEAENTVASLLKNKVRIDPDTGVWTEYEEEKTDKDGIVTVVSARYDMQTGYYIYQETVDGVVKTEGRYAEEDGKYFVVEAISWIVLETKADSYVLISRDILDAGHRFLDVYTSSTWKDSSMRDWLNGTDTYAKGGEDYTKSWNFVNRAFTQNELDQIKSSNLNTKDNEQYDVVGGGETTDLVYLLSEEEVATYFKDFSAQSGGTPYALYKGLKANKDKGIWWLRSPGINTFFQGVDRNGDVSEGGFNSTSTDIGIRPVICVSKNAIKFN